MHIASVGQSIRSAPFGSYLTNKKHHIFLCAGPITHGLHLASGCNEFQRLHKGSVILSTGSKHSTIRCPDFQNVAGGMSNIIVFPTTTINMNMPLQQLYVFGTWGKFSTQTQRSIFAVEHAYTMRREMEENPSSSNTWVCFRMYNRKLVHCVVGARLSLYYTGHH